MHPRLQLSPNVSDLKVVRYREQTQAESFPFLSRKIPLNLQKVRKRRTIQEWKERSIEFSSPWPMNLQKNRSFHPYNIHEQVKLFENHPRLQNRNIPNI